MVSDGNSLFEMVGVSPEASVAEVRKAYRQRVRAVHPDRFDPKRHPEQWSEANQALRELNEAYQRWLDEIDPARQDNGGTGSDEIAEPARPPRTREDATAQPPRFAPSFSFSGVIRLEWRTLTDATKRTLAALGSQRESARHITLETAPDRGPWLWWLYSALAAGALFGLCWLPQWAGEVYLVAAPLAALAAVGLVMALTGSLAQWRWRGTPGIVLTRLYCVRMRRGELWVWSLPDMLDAEIEHRVAGRRKPAIRLQFSRQSLRLRLRTQEEADALLARLRQWKEDWRHAADANEAAYFLGNDEFLPLRRERRLRSAHHGPSALGLAARALASLTVTGVLLMGARAWNHRRDDSLSWLAAQRAGTAGSYRDYLIQHPAGAHRVEAVVEIRRRYNEAANRYRHTVSRSADPAAVQSLLAAITYAREFGATAIQVSFRRFSVLSPEREEELRQQAPDARLIAIDQTALPQQLMFRERLWMTDLQRVLSRYVPADLLRLEPARDAEAAARLAVRYEVGFGNGLYTLQSPAAHGELPAFAPLRFHWHVRMQTGAEEGEGFEIESGPPADLRVALHGDEDRHIYTAMLDRAFADLLREMAERFGMRIEQADLAGFRQQ